MRKKLLTVALAFACALTCMFGFAGCGDEKDENDIIAESDWKAAFAAAENSSRYFWDYDCDCHPEGYPVLTGGGKSIGYNAEEKQYMRSSETATTYFWEKDGKYYRTDNAGTAEIKADRYTQYTTFADLEKPFLLSFCKDKFSAFKYCSVSLDDGSVEYKAENVNVAILRDGDANTHILSGTALIYVTFNRQKAITEIKAFVDSNVTFNGRKGYRVSEIGTYDPAQFDGFTLPEQP